MSSSKKAQDDDVVLGDGATAGSKTPLDMVSPDATVPGVDAADTTGAHAPDDSTKGEK